VRERLGMKTDICHRVALYVEAAVMSTCFQGASTPYKPQNTYSVIKVGEVFSRSGGGKLV